MGIISKRIIAQKTISGLIGSTFYVDYAYRIKAMKSAALVDRNLLLRIDMSLNLPS